MLLRAHISILTLAVLAGCAGDPKTTTTEPQVLGQEGQGTNLEQFEVREQSRLMTVRVFNRGGSARTIAVSARSFRGLDRADGQLALNAATKAGTRVECVGQPLRILADSALFQEQGRRSAFTNGEAAWVFRAQCG
ncbi:MAG: hypothetical protein AB8B85_00235 [Paracoccaceae bacterium]